MSLPLVEGIVRGGVILFILEPRATKGKVLVNLIIELSFLSTNIIGYHNLDHCNANSLTPIIIQKSLEMDVFSTFVNGPFYEEECYVYNIFIIFSQ